MVVTDFMFQGGDGFMALLNGHVVKTKLDTKIVMHIIMDYVRETKVVSPGLEGRVVSLSLASSG